MGKYKNSIPKKETENKTKKNSFKERAEKNSVCRADVKSVLSLIMAQTLRYCDRDNVSKLLLIVEKIISSSDIYILKCNMDISAAETAVSAIDSEYPHKSMC